MAFTATNWITLDNETFASLVLEKKLSVFGPDSDGYCYCGPVRGSSGDEVYRTPSSDWGQAPLIQGATADPAAGAEIATITVPVGKKWKLYSIHATLVSDATVANRYPYINIAPDGTNILLIARSSVAQTASLTIPWMWAPNNAFGTTTPAAISGYGMNIGLGIQDGLELPAGAIITFLTTGIVAGDNWGVCRYRYKELPV